MEWKSFIRDRIREARKLARLTQAELAEAVGVDNLTVSKFERGRVLPSVETVEKIATATRRPLDWFFRSRGQPVTYPILVVDAENLRHSVKRLADALALATRALHQLEELLPAELTRSVAVPSSEKKAGSRYPGRTPSRASVARDRPAEDAVDADCSDGL